MKELVHILKTLTKEFIHNKTNKCICDRCKSETFVYCQVGDKKLCFRCQGR